MLNKLISDIETGMWLIQKHLDPELAPDDKGSDIAADLNWIPSSPHTTGCLHLFTLLFEEMKISCAVLVEERKLIEKAVKLLESATQCLQKVVVESTPKWLPFLVLLIDIYEKSAVMSKRKAPLLLAQKRQWKWFDDRSGKWNSYTEANNKTIDDAYRNNEQSVRFTAGRRHYTVHLTTMVQINEETGNWRPIMLVVDSKDEKDVEKRDDNKSKEKIMDMDETSMPDLSSASQDFRTQCEIIKIVNPLTDEQGKALVRICVMLIGIPVDIDTVHAVLRLCLRLTRKHIHAMTFASMNGPKLLLSLRQPYNFPGIESLVTLLFRHIIEDALTLASTMEKVIRSATVGGSSSLFVSKEMHYVFRVLGPASCRDPEIFSVISVNALRIALLPMSKREEEDNRYSNSYAMQMLKACPMKLSIVVPPEHSRIIDVTSVVIYDLLNALAAKHELAEEGATTEVSGESVSGTSEHALDSTANDLLQADDDDGAVIPLNIPNVDGFSDSTESISSVRDASKSKESGKEIKGGSKGLVFNKSQICRTLSELVRSYCHCAKLIAEYHYRAGDTELITEDCSALAFIMDNLLHQEQTAGDRDSPALAKVLIASVASCSHSTEAQATLVNEVKSALHRALLLPESSEKHSRIQALTGLISTMIESCPSSFPQLAARSQESGMNNVVRILLRKGIVMDLARIPHHLDLSSPHMAATVNSALKPLETLSRIVNMPTGQLSKLHKVKTSSFNTESRTAVPETMEDESTSANCEAAVDEPPPLSTNESQVQDISIDSELEGIMNELLDRHSSNVSEPISIRSGDQQESTDSESNSGSCQSRCEDEVGRDEHVDDEEEEDDEDDDDDDDEASHFEFGDDYQDIENTFFRIQDREDSLVFQLEEVFPASGPSVVFGGSDAVRTYQMPVVTDEAANGADATTPSVPTAPRTVPTAHPLLVRQSDTQYNVPTRMHRRQRGYRPNIANHTWHMYTSGNTSTRHPNPPAILQRLLGPNTAQDLLQLTSNFNSHQPTAQTRVVLANSDFRIFAADDEVFEMQDQNTLLPADSSGPLASIPSTLNRWAEEARVLDGDSIHDCVTGIKPNIIKCLESYRDDEIYERKEKRRKLQEEDDEGRKTGCNTKNKANDELDESLQDSNSSQARNRTSGTFDSAAMDVAEPASQFESNISSTCNLPVVNISESIIDQDIRTLSTERLAASIVEQVLGPALSISSSSNVQPSTNSTLASDSDANVITPQIAEATAAAITRFVPSTSTSPVQAMSPAVLSSPSNTLLNFPDLDGFNTISTPMDTTEPEHDIPSSSDLLRMSQILSQELSFQSDNCSANQFEDSVPFLPHQNILTPEQSSTAGPEDLSAVVNTNSERILINAASPNTAIDGCSTSGDQGSTLLEANSCSDAAISESLSSSLLEEINDATSVPSSLTGVLSSRDIANVIGEIPEGVDPSFLAALPDNIRQEVIAEQLRLQRLRQRAHANSSHPTNEGNSFTEVNPEFLAALPPNIQEEVLAQQRAEQQRLAAQNSGPDTPVDPTSFIQTLPQGLRQQVLADMDDSLLALLPSELATEAHSLRRELEARHRQIQERFFSSHAGTALSRILRSAGRVGTRYTIHTLPHRGQWAWNALSSRANSGTSGDGGGASSSSVTSFNSLRLRGRQLLDHEALACLLVLLFVDEPQLNTTRLHRVLRNLCHHGPTRHWVVQSLLSILEKTKDCHQSDDSSLTRHRHKRSCKNNTFGVPSVTTRPDVQSRTGQPSWLSISLDAALGCRTNVFQVRRLTIAQRRAYEKHHSPSFASAGSSVVTIHPLASPVVCRHVLDTLISLAKSFPLHFLPETPKEEKQKDSSSKWDRTPKTIPLSCKTDSKQTLSVKASPSASSRTENDFWDVLVKLDSLSTTRKGKSVLRTHSGGNSNVSSPGSASDEDTKYAGFEASPLAQLISLLSHPVVKRSSLLTDRLLRLLALIALALPEYKSTPTKQSRDLSTSSRRQATEVPSCNRDGTPERGSPEDRGFPPASDVVFKKPALFKEKENNVMKQHLKLAVEVLTSKTCSEEGLEDATALLLRLSDGCPRTRHTVLYLLLDGARELGHVVCQHIRALISELQKLNAHLASQRTADSEERDIESEGKLQLKGTIQDRFTNSSVIITAPSKVKGCAGKELQLPSMSSLTSKTSSQAFFLRVLKVIISIRECSIPVKYRFREEFEHETEADTALQATSNSVAQPPEPISSNASITLSDAITTADDAQSLAVPMDVEYSNDQNNESTNGKMSILSEILQLDELWEALSDCLLELAVTPDHHAVLVLQPAVEAFFLVHAVGTEKEMRKRRENKREVRENQMSHINQDMAPLSPLSSAIENTSPSSSGLKKEHSSTPPPLMPLDTYKFLKFAETHRTVLNQILRQSTTPLADGPFSVLVDHTRVLDFDVKRRYFRQELERTDEGARREDLAVHVRREHVFEDSFRELHRRAPEEWKNRFYIVFEGEEGQDAGGLLREWYTIISREIFNPMYALFTTSPGDRVTYMINSSSHCNSNHLSYFKFVGRVIAKAVYDNKLLESYFTRSFYKHILGKLVRYTDMESEDYSFYQGLVFLLEHDVKELGYELTFSVEVQEFGVTEIRDLKSNGRNVLVTEDTKNEYVRLVCQEKMTGAIRKQLNAFLEGFYEIIPKRLISIFNEQELELLISGLPNIDIDDLKANTEYHKYQPTSLQIQWFWRSLRSFDQADRANFLQFVTGTSKVPLQGFAALEGMNGTQKFQIHRDDRSTDRLPSAHTCFNQLDLPAYETHDKLRLMLLKAIHECSEGFGFA